MRVEYSRFTPGLKNGKDVALRKGDKVTYRTRKGKIFYDVIIDSDLMRNGEYLGYEAILPDGRFFIVDEGIVDWEGKGALE